MEKKGRISMKKKTLLLVSLLMVLTLMIAGITGCSNRVSKEVPAKQQTVENSAGSAEGKLAWYFPLPHPFGEAVKVGVEAFEKDYSIAVNKVIGTNISITEQTEKIEAMLSKGYRNFAAYPSDSTGVNSLYEEIVAQGGSAITFGAPCTTPTPGSFLVATDIYAAETMATEKLIELMSEQGNILNVLESLTDPNTVIRKRAIEDTVAKYPNVKIIQEIADMTTNEEALIKIQDGMSSNIGNIDGIICTGFTGSIALAQIMDEHYQKNNKKIWTVVVDDDPVILEAIKNSAIDATRAQNPYGIGYISMLLSKYLAEGWTSREGTYSVDTGAVMVTKDNVSTYLADLQAVTDEIVSNIETNYVKKDA